MYIHACHILISEKEIVSITGKVDKQWRFVQNLLPFCDHCLLVIAKFQKAVICLSLVGFSSNYLYH